MRSPLSGKEMQIVIKETEVEFRKELFTIKHHSYLCNDTGSIMSSPELDILNQNQYYNKYREKYNIPFPDEIRQIRESYGISAAKMSEVLGLGINSYRQYESGEVPSVSNARLISLARDAEEFKKLVQISGVFGREKDQKFFEELDKLVKEKSDFKNRLSLYLMQGSVSECPGVFTGYTAPNFDKLMEMIIYFTEQMRPWKTKMNKLLFYADFLHFSKTCFGISGAEYVAIDLGPVPNNFNSVFEYAGTNDVIKIKYEQFPNGGVGELFTPNYNRKFNAALFDESEIMVMQAVVQQFRDTHARDIVALSHDEPAWTENIAYKKKISYDYAFRLEHGKQQYELN